MRKPLLYIVIMLLSCCTQQENKTASSTQSLGNISESLITVEQLQGKTAIELRLLRNEIFARKGYVFKDEILNDYFLKKEWYQPNVQAEVVLSDIEKQNIELIKKVETQRKVIADHATDEPADCFKKVVKKIQLEFKRSSLDFMGRYKVFSKELRDFTKNIDIHNVNIDEDGYAFSKTYYLHRNWDLEHIKEDECEDEIFLRYDEQNKFVVIQINNCSLYKEKGEADQISEQSIIIEFTIEKNCSYKFHKVIVAG
ncbi:YARHG domain-containing protein [Aquimarina litoralis]|uniref:YARHG domain-containing protein n=1 Tax=Aquimarina litoralis TaxID=584605 RepID=UPI001C591504|nr:YARHG domain-containing protein [Aquimarina litoralis]MBW1295953.1 YARHG domain-containing protein [Aquimarina litoralis]